jgi:uncharacterized protein YyaL (SSP411 family)
MLAQYPLGFGQWLQALSFTLSQPGEIAIIGEPEAADTQALLNVVRTGYRPFQVVALGEPGIDDMQLAQARQLPSNASGAARSIAAVPLLEERDLVDGCATAYVCRDFTCKTPIAKPEELRAQLNQT